MNRKILVIVLLFVSITISFAGQMEMTVAQSFTPTLQPTDDGGEPEFLPTENGSPVPTDPYEPEYIWSVAWSPDGSKIAYSLSPDRCNLEGENQYVVNVIEAESGQLLATYKQFVRCPTNDIIWSPDSNKLLISTRYGGILIWDVITKHTVRFFDIGGSFSPFADHSWNAYNNQIASISEGDSYIHIWDAFTGTPLITIPADYYPSSVTWSPDGKQLATNEEKITLRDAKTGKVSSVFPVGGYKLRWSSDASKIAAINGSYQIIILDALSGDVLQIVRGHTKNITNISWRSDNKVIASASEDGSIRLWDIESGNQIDIFNSDGPIYGFDWKSDGSKLAYGDNSGTLKIISISDMNPSLTYTPTAMH